MKHRFVFIFFCAGLCCLITGAPSKSLLSRERRHFAEFKVTEYATMQALKQMLSRCKLIGCGLINIEESGKRKRDNGELNQFTDEERQLLLSKLLQPVAE